MQALIYLPHCVADILAYATTGVEDYISMVFRVLRPTGGGTPLTPEGTLIREIYEMYSYKVRSVMAKSSITNNTPAYLSSIAKDDVKVISVRINMEVIPFIAENADRIREISGYHAMPPIIVMHDYSAFIPDNIINFRAHKNLISLDVRDHAPDIPQWIKKLTIRGSMLNINVPNFIEDLTIHGYCIFTIPENIKHLTIVGRPVYWEGMTIYGSEYSSPYRDASITRVTPRHLLEMSHTYESLLKVELGFSNITFEIERTRADGTFIPSFELYNTNVTNIDFIGIESASIIMLKVGPAANRITLTIDHHTLLPIERLLINRVKKIVTQYPIYMPHLVSLSLGDPRMYPLFRGCSTLKHLAIESARPYNDNLIIDEPLMVVLTLKNLNIEKLKIMRHNIIRATIYDDTHIERIREMFGNKYTINILSDDRAVRIDLLGPRKGDDPQKYRLYNIDGQYVYDIKDPTLYKTLKEY